RAAGAEIDRRQAGPGVDADTQPFTYPPFAAAPFVPYALLPAAWQAPLWFVVNFVIVLGLARWLHRHAGRADPALGPPRPVAFWLLVGVVGGRHVASVVTNQSLGGTFVRLFQPSQSAAKFVLGEPGTTLLAPLPAGVYRAVLHGAQLAVLAALTLATLRAATAVREAGRSSAGGAFGVGNAVGAPGAGNAVNAGDAVGAAAVRRTVALGEVGAFACGMLLLSPMSSKSHFCVWVFPVAFLAEGVLRGRRDALATALFVAAAVVGLLAKDLLGKSLGNVVLAYGNATWATVLLLLATVRQLGIEARAAGAAR
ncbi:MAG: glycosyltransferase 87 family protein, partial [Planctomycetota bacterium]